MRAFLTTVAAVVAAAAISLPVVAAGPGSPNASMVADLRAVGGSDPWDLTRVGGRVFFTASDGTNGRELWVSDGTEAGTVLVEDIRPGASGSSPRTLTRVGTRLYFTANDGIHGRELWVSDGSKSGTRLVKDLAKGPTGSSIEGIRDVAGMAYFDQAGRELWRTGGTPTSTRLVRGFGGVNVVDSVAKGARLFFTADGGLWKSDGSSAGTRRLSPKQVSVYGLSKLGSRVIFSAVPISKTGLDTFPFLWRSDGTRSGTKRVGDTMVDDPSSMQILDGALYFNGHRSGSANARLYRSDGTSAGTVPLSPRVRPFPLMVREAASLWSSNSLEPDFEPTELWASDGTGAGSRLVYGGEGDWYTSERDGLGGLDCAGSDGRIYFAAGPGGPDYGWEAVDTEVWASDGTTDGTMEVADIDPDGSSSPRDLVRLGDVILFSASDGAHGRELWRFEPQV